MVIIETERLYLRTWRPSDAEAYYQLNQNSCVSEFLAFPVAREYAAQFVIDMNVRFEKFQYTFWAVEEKISEQLVGFVGLQALMDALPFAPGVEIGWRLAYPFWGKGYATEAAIAVVEYAFTALGINEIVSYTVPANVRSQRVMEKIGMQRVEGGDFAHPRLPVDHPLSLHVLYKLSKV